MQLGEQAIVPFEVDRFDREEGSGDGLSEGPYDSPPVLTYTLLGRGGRGRLGGGPGQGGSCDGRWAGMLVLCVDVSGRIPSRGRSRYVEQARGGWIGGGCGCCLDGRQVVGW
jgi:hypothetical protein